MDNKLTIVCSGPESSGKTALAEHLRDYFGLPLVPEYARPYLEALSRPYNIDDVQRIGQRQEDEEKQAAKKHEVIVTDTDWLTIHIWLREKYKADTALHEDVNKKLYLLCYPDLPWEPDPLRENPHDRHRLYMIHEAILRDKNALFMKVYGQDIKRHKRVTEFLRKNLFIN